MWTPSRPALIAVIESVSGIQKQEFCGRAKSALIVAAKEALVLAGRRSGATATDLARLTGLDVACISRRHDAAVRRSKEDESFRYVVTRVIQEYQE